MSMFCCEDFGHKIGHLIPCLTILGFEYVLHDVFIFTRPLLVRTLNDMDDFSSSIPPTYYCLLILYLID